MTRRYIGKSPTEEAMLSIDFTSEKVVKMSSDLVDQYCKELDELVCDIRLKMQTSESISDNELEQYILELAQCLYFVGAAQEDLGAKEDTAKAIRTEVYNNALKSTKGTVAEKEAAGILASQQQTIVNSIYTRAYKKVKFKVEAGYEMLNSLKKIMNKRIAEAELSNSKYINKQRDRGDNDNGTTVY